MQPILPLTALPVLSKHINVEKETSIRALRTNGKKPAAPIALHVALKGIKLLGTATVPFGSSLQLVWIDNAVELSLLFFSLEAMRNAINAGCMEQKVLGVGFRPGTNAIYVPSML